MRVRFTTSNPEDMTEDILHAIADEPNLCKHIHFPAQSGSNKILKLMNRKYTREEYLERIADIKRIIPGCGITTDIFVGYHDENRGRPSGDPLAGEGSRLRLCLHVQVFRSAQAPTLPSICPDNVPEETKIAAPQRARSSCRPR